MGSGKGQSIGDPGIYEQLKREYLGDVRAEIAWRFGSAVVPGVLS